jgi:hypothetical protein
MCCGAQALHRLLIILLNSRDVSERLGSLYAFKAYLHENEEGQLALASTLRSTPFLSFSLLFPVHFTRQLFSFCFSLQAEPHRRRR